MIDPSVITPSTSRTRSLICARSAIKNAHRSAFNHLQGDQVEDVNHADGGVGGVDDGDFVEAVFADHLDGVADDGGVGEGAGAGGHELADGLLPGGAAVLDEGAAEVAVGEDAGEFAVVCDDEE